MDYLNWKLEKYLHFSVDLRLLARLPQEKRHPLLKAWLRHLLAWMGITGRKGCRTWWKEKITETKIFRTRSTDPRKPRNCKCWVDKMATWWPRARLVQWKGIRRPTDQSGAADVAANRKALKKAPRCWKLQETLPKTWAVHLRKRRFIRKGQSSRFESRQRSACGGWVSFVVHDYIYPRHDQQWLIPRNKAVCFGYWFTKVFQPLRFIGARRS